MMMEIYFWFDDRGQWWFGVGSNGRRSGPWRYYESCLEAYLTDPRRE